MKNQESLYAESPQYVTANITGEFAEMIVHNGYAIKDQLKTRGYVYDPDHSVWTKTISKNEGPAEMGFFKNHNFKVVIGSAK